MDNDITNSFVVIWALVGSQELLRSFVNLASHAYGDRNI